MSEQSRLIGRVAASLAAIAAVTLGCAWIMQLSPTTIALTYVVVILLIATRWGIAESTAASLAAVLCFNFFFLPPVGTFTIADPQNWVALVAFLLTAIVASQLSGRARRRNIEALARQRDLERLYALSRALLLSEGGASLPGAIARHIADTFDIRTVGVYDQRLDRAVWAGSSGLTGSDDTLRDVARRGVTLHDPDGMTVVAIQLGGHSIGSVAIMDSGSSDTVLHSIANLAAIGLERARGAAVTARAEAARHSSEVRATVLDALAHEFKTPLTSMKAAASDLVSSGTAGARDRELATILDEELDRFQGLVTDAVQMLRIDTGEFAVHLDRHNLSDLVDASVRRFERQLDGHTLVKNVATGLTVDADRELLGLALRQLLDNALKYSPPNSTIEIRAGRNGGVAITVANSGSEIPHPEQARVLERFYRGSGARNIPGTGMGLTIVQQIAQAHRGTLAIASAPESGTAITLSLPRGDQKR
jgi:two-component system, OmpR family, sensor histidine kinase KdpD